MNIASSAALVHDDKGFGLIEIVVSMFMLALLSIAMLPLLITSVQQSARNAAAATASQLVQQTLEADQGKTTCSGIGSVINSTTTLQDTPVTSRGVTFQRKTDIGRCPIDSNHPQGTVRVTVTVSRSDPAGQTVLSAASTLVYVTGP